MGSTILAAELDILWLADEISERIFDGTSASERKDNTVHLVVHCYEVARCKQFFGALLKFDNLKVTIHTSTGQCTITWSTSLFSPCLSPRQCRCRHALYQPSKPSSTHRCCSITHPSLRMLWQANHLLLDIPSLTDCLLHCAPSTCSCQKVCWWYFDHLFRVPMNHDLHKCHCLGHLITSCGLPKSVVLRTYSGEATLGHV
mmetsp:Transcript_18099/g.35532  ORF Transcript_18099/g.35532 Transcript_18099/m.35532 type:complete len:201 (+) Transcript_18099:810-1412(+)